MPRQQVLGIPPRQYGSGKGGRLDDTSTCIWAADTEKPKKFVDDTSTCIWSSDVAATQTAQRGLLPRPASAAASTSLPRPSPGSAASSAPTREPELSQVTSRSGGSSGSGEAWQVSGRSILDYLSGFEQAPTNFRSGDFAFEALAEGREDGAIGPRGWSVKVEALGFAGRRLLAPKLHGASEVRGHLSAAHPILLSNQERCELELAQEAELVAFSYPVVAVQGLQVTSKDACFTDLALLVYGGFMYFDAQGALKDVRAAAPSAGQGTGVRLGAPRHWPGELSVAVPGHRWRPVTDAHLRAIGARFFVWLSPAEALPGVDVGRQGGFAFLFHDPADRVALQGQLDVYLAAGAPLPPSGASLQGKMAPVAKAEAGQICSDDTCAVEARGCPGCRHALQWSDYAEGSYESGWNCENLDRCGQNRESAGPTRWFCPGCELDFCETCYWELSTDVVQGSK